jgi:hypothetical protein
VVAPEAMSAKTPVVAFNIGHLPALIQEAWIIVPVGGGPPRSMERSTTTAGKLV